MKEKKGTRKNSESFSRWVVTHARNERCDDFSLDDHTTATHATERRLHRDSRTHTPAARRRLVLQTAKKL